MPLQHLEMANFCLDYLLSPALALSASEEEMEQRTKDGYFALHDYASIYFFNHLSYVAKSCAEGSDTVQKDLSVRCQSFVERYEISRHSRFSDQEDNPINVAQFVGSISDNARDRNKCYDIEWRTLRIRRVLEDYVKTLRSNTEAYHTALAMYGIRIFKCRKVDCRFYFEGFATRSERDAHADRHDRPYMCDHRGCPFQSLGFGSKVQLEKHIQNNHAVTDDAVCTFPGLHKIHDDTIFKAAARGDVTAVKDFLDQGAAIDQPSRPQGGETPLILAARNSQLNVCKLLLERGADVNFLESGASTKTTAIHAAVISGDIEILQCVLATKDVNPNQQDRFHYTPLMLAAKNGSSAMVKLLIDSKRVDFNYENEQALGLSDSDDVIDLLINCTNKETIQNYLFYNYHGSPILIKTLLRLGTWEVLLKESDERGDGLLHTAINFGSYRAAKLLVQLGKFKLDFVGSDTGLTPLSRVMHPMVTLMEEDWLRQDREDVIKMLIASEKVNLDTVDKQGQTPLSRAAESGNLNIVNVLLATGKVTVNTVDPKRRTPFSRAVQRGHKGIIQRFLATGKVDINTKDATGKTILGYALDSTRLEVAELLLRYEDARLNGGNIDEKTWDFFGAAERLHRIGAINDVDFRRLLGQMIG